METIKKNLDNSFLQSEFSPKTRIKNIEKLKEEVFDILIIGGGITGAGVACEASVRGFKTALVEKADFASGTSSKSSKLLHGGFRYLEKFKIMLVFEALKDRNILFKKIPNIARPMSFVAPIYKGYKETLPLLAMGISFYDFLSFISGNMVTRIHRLKIGEKIRDYEPNIKKEGLKGGIQYFDGACDDARLTVENIKTAAKEGTVTANYVKIIGFEKDDKGISRTAVAKDLISGETFKIHAQRILNAAGPWVDAVNKTDNHDYKNRLKPTKGVHIIIPRVTEDNAILLKTPEPPVRWVFIIPYQSYSLVGTTDTETKSYEYDYSYLDNDNYASTDEIKYLLDTVNYYYPDANLTEKDIISSFGGWRPLIAPPPDSKLSESDISREHDIFETDSGIICIAGGKLTTYMAMSEQIVDYFVKKKEFNKFAKNPSEYPQLVCWESGNSFEEYIKKETKKYNVSERQLIRSLINKYGSEYQKIYDIMKNSPEMKGEIKNLSKDAACFRGEVVYSVLYEMSMNVKDFMMRRNRIILKDKNQGLGAVSEIAVIMGDILGDMFEWAPDNKENWIKEQINQYKNEVELVNSGKK